MTRLLRDRADAGRRLAAALGSYAGRKNVIVLGLPRGGVPVAFEIAVSLGAPLDVLVVRKLGLPGNEELAIGAIASGGARVINEGMVRSFEVSPSTIERVAAIEAVEMQRREKAYRGDRAPLDVRGRVVILADDGLATGATMLAAVKALRTRDPARIVVACGVGSPDTCAAVTREADECVCVLEPRDLEAVSRWYEHFGQTEDEEVRSLLAASAKS